MYGFAYRVACPTCRQLVHADELDEHVCAVDVVRAVGAFEAAFAAWLETAQGRFAAWDAARTHR